MWISVDLGAGLKVDLVDLADLEGGFGGFGGGFRQERSCQERWPRLRSIAWYGRVGSSPACYSTVKHSTHEQGLPQFHLAAIPCCFLANWSKACEF